MKKNRPKLLIVTPEFPPEQWGGLARTVLKVVSHAVDLGLDAHVARLTVESGKTPLLDENLETIFFSGIKTHNIIVGKEKFHGRETELWDCPHNLSLQMMFQSLESLEETENYDLFQSFFLYPVGYVTGLLAKKRNKPLISCIVGNDVNKYFFSPEKVAVCKSGLDNSDFVVGLSTDLIQLANALSPIRERSCVIYNSVEIPEDSWVPRPQPDGPVKIGCAGIFKYAKGLPYLFKAMANLSKKWDIVLDLRGLLRDSEKEIFYKTLSENLIEQKVALCEPLPHEAISEWLRTLDIFVLPSVTEGCPNILMEALATGVPTVASQVGAVPDLICNGVSGLLVPPGDSAALAQAIEQFLSNNALAVRLGAAAREKMRKFSREKERDDWRKVYRRFMEI